MNFKWIQYEDFYALEKETILNINKNEENGDNVDKTINEINGIETDNISKNNEILSDSKSHSDLSNNSIDNDCINDEMLCNDSIDSETDIKNDLTIINNDVLAKNIEIENYINLDSALIRKDEKINSVSKENNDLKIEEVSGKNKKFIYPKAKKKNL